MYANIISIDRNSIETLQTQIRRQMATAIMGRQFPLKTALPSIRRLARDLQVSVTTVAIAYDLLKSDGFIISRARSGLFINPDVIDPPPSTMRISDTTSSSAHSRSPFKKILKNRDLDLSHVSRPPDALVRYKFPFITGIADPSLFPLANWRECVRDSTNVIELRNWAGDFSLLDDSLLIENLIQQVLVRRGVHAHPDEIMITVGGQQGVYIALKLLQETGGLTGIESPGYPDVSVIARLEGINAIGLPIDDEGLVTSSLPDGLTCVYVTPNNQFPTNVTMSQRRRQELLALAAQREFFIIEDDYDAEIHFGADQPPALKSKDREGRVIYVGSLGEALMPGLRIGYTVADREFISQAKALRHHILRHPPVNNQHAVALFLQRGFFSRHLSKLRPEYARRCDAMYDALEKAFPGHAREPNRSASSIWFRLPKGLTAKQVRQTTIQRGLYFDLIASHDPARDESGQFIRLGFSVVGPNRIVEGIDVLRDTIRELNA